MKNGARVKEACPILEITHKTYRKWVNLFKKTGSYEDLRPKAERNLTRSVDKNEVISILTSEEYQDKKPCEIVPDLADKGIYCLRIHFLSHYA